ncbi:putative membrane protein [Bradyrhizobium sp. USDA 4461]
MHKLSITTALATIAIVLAPAVAVAQGTESGAGTGGPSSAGPTSPQTTSPPAGTNTAGTAQSSGGPNTGKGMTTGSATTTESVDKAIADENKEVDRRTKGICRGC